MASDRKNSSIVWRLGLLRLVGLFLALTALAVAPATPAALADEPPSSPDPRFQIGELLFQDDFTRGLADRWTPELERGGSVRAQDGKLLIDVPAGCTVWFKPPLDGPVLIQYQATAIRAGGPNDRVSDLNCFWMARDARNPSDLFAVPRGGKFADYDLLRCYYVGLGGNANTTTRFRRYVGEKSNRPLLPEHDLSASQDLLAPNAPQTLALVACGPLIQFYRHGQRMFELNDPQAYTSGWFGFRTVTSHLEIKAFRVYRLVPVSVAKP